MRRMITIVGLLLALMACKNSSVSNTTPVITSSGPTCRFPVFQPHTQGQPLKTVEGGILTAWDPYVMADPGGCTLLGNGGTTTCYRMWYTEWLSASKQLGIAYAESLDGIVWTLLRDQQGLEQHVITPTQGSWDAKLETVTVLKHGGQYSAWYLAYPGPDVANPDQVLQSSGRRKVLGHATSTDGIRWTKYPKPVVVPEADWEQPYTKVVVVTTDSDGSLPPGTYQVWDGGLQEPSVVWDPITGQLRLWYEANTMALLPGSAQRQWMQWIGTATSTDGINWSKHPGNPVFRPSTASTDAWDSGTVGHTNVTRDPVTGEFNLFYVSGGYAVSIGHARSSDGVNWERNPQNPVVRSTLLGDNVLIQQIRQAQQQGTLQNLSLPNWVIVYGGPSLVGNPDGSVHVSADGRLRLYGFRHPPGKIYNTVGGDVEAVLFQDSCS